MAEQPELRLYVQLSSILGISASDVACRKLDSCCRWCHRLLSSKVLDGWS